MKVDMNRLDLERRLFGTEMIAAEGYGVTGAWAKWYIALPDCRAGSGSILVRFNERDPGSRWKWHVGGSAGPDVVATDLCQQQNCAAFF